MSASKKIIVFAIVMFVSSSVIAQERTLTDEQKVKLKTHFKKSFEKLDLSEEQKPKFKEITKKYALQLKTLKNSDKSKSTKEHEFISIINSKNKEMQVFLTTQQYKVYEENQKERLRKLEYLKKLDLSNEQKPRFKEIIKKYALQIKTLKSSDKSKFAKYKEFKSIMNSKNKEMKVLLLEKQYIVYEKAQIEFIRKIKQKIKENN